MSDFHLNENDDIYNKKINHQKTKKGLTAKLIDWGLAKNESQANLYMITVIIICFGLIIFINLDTFSSPTDIYIEEVYE